MEFLSSLHVDVKLLLVASALALFAALVSGSKKKEHRYMAVFTLLMVVAGVRFRQETDQDVASVREPMESTTVSHARAIARPAPR